MDSRIMTRCMGSPLLRMVKVVGLIFSLFEIVGCTYTTAVSTTNIPANRNRKITAKTERYIILGFVFDNDEVLALPSMLADKCPGGVVQGITTQNMNTLYLLEFFWKREVVATGYCVKSSLAEGPEIEDPTIDPVSKVSMGAQSSDEVEL